MPALRTCIEKLYLEVFPVEGIERQLLGMPDGAYIGVTCSPRQGLDMTLDLVEKLHGHDFHLVPHIAARQVRDVAHLREIIARLRDQGVESMFVPGGDIPEPVGAFDSSLALLRELAGLDHGLLHIGVAAHPEGHPIVDDDTLYQCLRDKQELATYLVTQMCFDPQVLVTWLAGIREQGIHLPAWIGLPGVMNRMKLFKTSLRIGVGESARFAMKQGALTGKLLRASNYAPDELVQGLSPAIREQRLGIDGFYLFSFNQVRETITWRDGLLASMTASSAAVC